MVLCREALRPPWMVEVRAMQDAIAGMGESGFEQGARDVGGKSRQKQAIEA